MAAARMVRLAVVVALIGAAPAWARLPEEGLKRAQEAEKQVRANNTDAAIKTLQKLDKDFPTESAISLRLAQVYDGMGRNGEALFYYRRYITRAGTGAREEAKNRVFTLELMSEARAQADAFAKKLGEKSAAVATPTPKVKRNVMKMSPDGSMTNLKPSDVGLADELAQEAVSAPAASPTPTPTKTIAVPVAPTATPLPMPPLPPGTVLQVFGETGETRGLLPEPKPTIAPPSLAPAMSPAAQTVATPPPPPDAAPVFTPPPAADGTATTEALASVAGGLAASMTTPRATPALIEIMPQDILTRRPSPETEPAGVESALPAVRTRPVLTPPPIQTTKTPPSAPSQTPAFAASSPGLQDALLPAAPSPGAARSTPAPARAASGAQAPFFTAKPIEGSRAVIKITNSVPGAMLTFNAIGEDDSVGANAVLAPTESRSMRLQPGTYHIMVNVTDNSYPPLTLMDVKFDADVEAGMQYTRRISPETLERSMR
jgi:hypothetical protein